jgi:prepilin-type processing-associated H-X9-DG protein
MGEKVIYTIGYGNNTPEEFLERLKVAGVTLVVDVRRRYSKAWCNSYHSGNNMRNYLMLDGGVAYCQWPWIANNHSSLCKYKRWLYAQGVGDAELLSEAIKNAVENNGRVCCLLCAEGDPYEKDGETVRCHRIYLADALVAQLGEGWSVCHL